MSGCPVPEERLRDSIRRSLVTPKSFACPIALRVAWHASGTFDPSDAQRPGGSQGATMRFDPERSDPANAGLGIVRDMLHGARREHPQVSMADMWGYAGCVSSELMGGPKVEYKFGRTDDADNRRCPLPGRLPDASKGADHLREVFGRMGFTDRDIVALSGAHTVGRCHAVRSGYDGPWTQHPLRFDNEYFRNLINLDWVVKEWDGKFMYTDRATRTLAMLPTDMALKTDPSFRPIAEEYAADQDAFFRDFSRAYARLLSLGCPAKCVPSSGDPGTEKMRRDAEVDLANARFREFAMHGSVDGMKRHAALADVNGREGGSGRTALHKAAFWGHTEAIGYLLSLGANPDATDGAGDTALHDAARFGHADVCKALIKGGASRSVVNKEGQDVLATAVEYGKDEIVQILRSARL